MPTETQKESRVWKIPEPGQENGQLSNAAAQEDANMLNAHLGTDASDGTVAKLDGRPIHASDLPGTSLSEREWTVEKPTAADYEHALLAIEKLKIASEQEAGSKRLLLRFGKIIQKAGFAGLLALDALVGGDQIMDYQGYQSNLQQVDLNFESARDRLQKLKEQAEDYAKSNRK